MSPIPSHLLPAGGGIPRRDSDGAGMQAPCVSWLGAGVGLGQPYPHTLTLTLTLILTLTLALTLPVTVTLALTRTQAPYVSSQAHLLQPSDYNPMPTAVPPWP